ncbi:unnamed protein product [Orchesella dallaii]|uniref:Signal peptidase complex subunit 3 n=1 Tax=Orchesella dallaii TaxID=48710 RepID=A0ABP1PRA3_9HEXA
MYRGFERLNVVFTYGVITLTVCVLALNLTTFFKDFSRIETVNLDFKGFSGFIKNSSRYPSLRVDGSHETAFLTLDAEADFQSMFNWNVKQLFVSVVVEYVSPMHARNEVVVWDKIIVREGNALINTNKGSRYMHWDDGTGLRGLKANWRLKWNVIRNVGPMADYQSPAYEIEFPKEYSH